MPLRIYASRTLTRGQRRRAPGRRRRRSGCGSSCRCTSSRCCGYSPIRAGLAFLPMTLCIVVGIDARLARRDPRRRQAAAGGRHELRWRSGCCCSPSISPGGSYLGDVLVPVAAGGDRDRAGVRAGDDRGGRRRRAPGGRPGLGAGQHLPAVRRRARAGHPGRDRHRAHQHASLHHAGATRMHAALTSGFQLAFVVAAAFAVGRRAGRCVSGCPAVPARARAASAAAVAARARRLRRPRRRRHAAVETSRGRPPWPAASSPASCPARRSTACAPRTRSTCGPSGCRRRPRSCAAGAAEAEGLLSLLTDRVDADAARPLPAAAGDRQLRGRLRQHRPRGRRARAGSRSATRPTCSPTPPPTWPSRCCWRPRAGCPRRSPAVRDGEWLTWEPGQVPRRRRPRRDARDHRHGPDRPGRGRGAPPAST